MSTTLSVCIPAIESTQSLQNALRRIPGDLWADIGVVAVLDDGSVPLEREFTEALRRRYPKLKFVSTPRQLGYGMAVRRGLGVCREADSDYAACFRADDKSSAEMLVKLLSHMEIYGMDLLQGSRPHGGGKSRGLQNWLEQVLVRLENRYLDLKLSDVRPGCMVYARKALRAIPFERLSHGSSFDLEVLACARELKLRIGEVELSARETAPASPWTQSVQVLTVLTKFKLGYYRDTRRQ